MKKIIWTLLIVILGTGVAFGAYWYFEQKQRTGNETTPLSVGELFPFGRGTNTTTDPTPIVPIAETSTPQTPTELPRVWKISHDRQSGSGILVRDTETFIRFVDTATGNVFENKLGTRDLARISNTTIPKVKNAIWSQKGDSVILRYTNENNAIQTLHGKLVGTTTNTGETTSVQELEGSFLASSITNLSLFGPQDKIFYTVLNGAGNTVGFAANIDGTKSVRLFESPFREWSVVWPKAETVVITTKPSGMVTGFSYLVSTRNGTLQRLIGNILGLSTLPAFDLGRIVYSTTVSNGTSARLHSFNVNTNADGILGNTLAEKCVWMKDNLNVVCAVPKNFPSGTYPDDWYKGKVSFADTFVMYNTDTNRSMTVLDPAPIAREDIDATHLALDPNEQFLTFTNKKDGSLWALRVTTN